MPMPWMKIAMAYHQYGVSTARNPARKVPTPMISVPVASGNRGPRRSSRRAPMGMNTSMLTVDGSR